MKPLTQRQAANCENAKTPASRCRCRCRGRFHGAGRVAPEAWTLCRPKDPHRRRDPHGARITIVLDESTPERLVIRDIGPWDKHRTVTNDAEDVVNRLVADGLLLQPRRLFYYDSERQLDEILIRNDRFAGFAPGPRG